MPIEMDEIYKKMKPEDIPWNIVTPPTVLIELVESGKIPPCKTIDFGCGTGNYAVYLAEQGFEVTGVDISPAAVKIAQERVRKAMNKE